MISPVEQLARAARQLVEIEELFGGVFIPAERASLPEIQRPEGTAPRVRPEEKAGLLNEIATEIADCRRCPLSQSRHKCVPGEGNPDADLVFVGEAPGRDEDMSGRPFVGRAGKLLTKMISAMGLSRDDIFICNILKCRPPNNRDPDIDEVTACYSYLLRQLEIIAPRVIITMGNPATKNLLRTKTGITRLRGQWQSLPDLSDLDDQSGAGAALSGIAVMPTFHPSYVLRQYNADTRGKVWSDLMQVMEYLGLKLPQRKT